MNLPFSTREKMYLATGRSLPVTIRHIFCLRVLWGIFMAAETPGGSRIKSVRCMISHASSPSLASSNTIMNWKSLKMPDLTRSRSLSCCSVSSPAGCRTTTPLLACTLDLVTFPITEKLSNLSRPDAWTFSTRNLTKRVKARDEDCPHGAFEMKLIRLPTWGVGR